MHSAPHESVGRAPREHAAVAGSNDVPLEERYKSQSNSRDERNNVLANTAV